MVNKSTIAIIPARGGSKRLPRKNILAFFGKPLIAWTIEAAIKSNAFERVIVSTNDEEIAEISRNYGADVPFLRDKFSDDFSTSSQATCYALGQAEEHYKAKFDTVAQLMPNCPLRNDGDIKRALNHFECFSAKYQISCFRFGWMNPWWAATIDDKGSPHRIFPEYSESRSQDLPPLFCPSGAIWIADSESIKKEKTFYGSGHIFYPMDWKACVDIDDQDDFDFAKVLFNIRESGPTS